MNLHILISITVLTLGFAGFVHGCCFICLWCSRGVINANQVLNGEVGSLTIANEQVGLQDNLQVMYEGEGIPPITFMAICDTSEDDFLDWDEFSACLNNHEATLEESFDTLDANNDDKLSQTELKKFSLSMTESGDCYSDLSTHCSAQYVMYERVRGLSRKSVCGGFELYFDCIGNLAAKCHNPKAAKLQAIFKWTQEKLKPACDEESTSAQLTPTMKCSASMVHSLQGTQTPCVALADFNNCLLTNAEAKEGERPFEDVVQMAGCDQKANKNTNKGLRKNVFWGIRDQYNEHGFPGSWRYKK